MLTHIEIRNFRSCRHVVLDGLASMTALVGRNGAGKTNVLQAIEWAAASTVRDDAWDTDGIKRGASSVRLGFHVGDQEYWYVVQAGEFSKRIEYLSAPAHPGTAASEHLVERRDESVKLADGTLLRLGPDAPLLATVETRLAAEHPALESIRQARTFLAGLHYTTLAEPEFQSDSEFVIPPDAGPVAGLDDAIAALFHLRRQDPLRYVDVTAVLGPQGLDLTEVQFEMLIGQQTGGKTYYLPRFRPSAQEDWFRFGQLSYGTRRLVRFFTALFARDYSVLLLEHLEEGLHPGLLRKVIDVLKSYSDRGQLILTTHSPTVLNLLEPRQLRFVTMRAGETLVRALSAQELEAARRYIEFEGSLAEFAETLDDD